MLNIRKKDDRGHARIGWLNSWHSFSFADYYDPKHMGFGHLRVLNDDRIDAASGFGTHPHQNMEIITYVLDGVLEHKDSMGNGGLIRPGDVQRMSAGTGIAHSEFNHSKTESVHLLQIWFLPDAQGYTPGYQQKTFSDADKRGQFKLVVSNHGKEGSLSLNQDVNFYAGLFNGDEQDELIIPAQREVWIQVALGSINVNGQTLTAGDGASLTKAGTLNFTHGNNANVVVFDMARRQ